ncbi:class I adenylate-forming enzyme family protein [Patulibacter defluvii]|uniref:class I adenylate-forming enzyme family protein n=1 Tax=Patulibacter defluvii TaxID=3095358 RepID=UPI002A751080|nr:AMP-binding protein [Patulibacter sp. DM4]
MAERAATASIVELPDRRAAANPDGGCVADDRGAAANGEFLDRVKRAAGALRGAGVGPGDVVAVALPNRSELLVTLFAAWRLGAAMTPINPALTAAERQYQVDDAGATVVVSDGLDVDAAVIDVTDLCAGPPLEEPAESVPEHALALLIYTSGTTGKPKGVMLDHRNVAVMCAMVGEAIAVDERDHCLLILPLFHVNAIVVSALTPLLAGGRVTVVERFSPSAFIPLVEQLRPTYFSAVPAIYAMLTAREESHSADFSSLRLVVCGAAPMPAEEIARVEERFGVVLVEGYGLSEGTCASTINPIDGVRKPGTVGLPLPGQEVIVVDPEGRPVPQGERGEVVIRGENVMRGYLNRPEATADTVDGDGWLHTGDVGILDEDGYLRIVDRIKDMIIRGGENIYPKEIENVLYGHDDVLEAAVIGRPDDVLGEVVVAYVSLRPDATVDADQLHDLCNERLAKYKRPVAIHLLDELPKNPVGKLDKPTLRTQDAAAISPQPSV